MPKPSRCRSAASGANHSGVRSAIHALSIASERASTSGRERERRLPGRRVEVGEPELVRRVCAVVRQVDRVVDRLGQPTPGGGLGRELGGARAGCQPPSTIADAATSALGRLTSANRPIRRARATLGGGAGGRGGEGPDALCRFSRQSRRPAALWPGRRFAARRGTGHRPGSPARRPAPPIHDPEERKAPVNAHQ